MTSHVQNVRVERLYTIDQVAEFAQQSRRTIERRIADGTIRVRRFSARCVRIPESAVWAYLEQGGEAPSEGGTVIAFPTTEGGTA